MEPKILRLVFITIFCIIFVYRLLGLLLRLWGSGVHCPGEPSLLCARHDVHHERQDELPREGVEHGHQDRQQGLHALSRLHSR